MKMRTEIVKISVLFLQFYKIILSMFYENKRCAFTKRNVYVIMSKNVRKGDF